jgi:hypothetical protein
MRHPVVQSRGEPRWALVMMAHGGLLRSDALRKPGEAKPEVARPQVPGLLHFCPAMACHS